MKAVSYADGKVKTSEIQKPSGEGVLVNIQSADCMFTNTPSPEGF